MKRLRLYYDYEINTDGELCIFTEDSLLHYEMILKY